MAERISRFLETAAQRTGTRDKLSFVWISVSILLALPVHGFMFYAIGKPALEHWGEIVALVVLADLLAWQWYDHRPSERMAETTHASNVKSGGGALMGGMPLSYISYRCIYHIVLVPEYRRKTMFEGQKKEISETIIRVCGVEGAVVMDMVVQSDHVDLTVSIPPKESVKTVVCRIKAATTLELIGRKRYRYSYPLWSKGYVEEWDSRYVSKVRPMGER